MGFWQESIDFPLEGVSKHGRRFMYVGPGKKIVQCLDIDGNRLWHREFDKKIERVLPSPSGNYAIVGTKGNTLLFLGPDGTTKWQRQGATVQVGIDENRQMVYLYERAQPAAVSFDGEIYWIKESLTSKESWGVSMACSEDGSHVFAMYDYKMYCLSPSGEIIWVSRWAAYGGALESITASRNGTSVAWINGVYDRSPPFSGSMYLLLADANGAVRELDVLYTGAARAAMDESGRTLLFFDRHKPVTKVFRDGILTGQIATQLTALSDDGLLAAAIEKGAKVSCWDVRASIPKKVLEKGPFEGMPVLLHIDRDHKVRVVCYDKRATQSIKVSTIIQSPV